MNHIMTAYSCLLRGREFSRSSHIFYLVFITRSRQQKNLQILELKRTNQRKAKIKNKSGLKLIVTCEYIVLYLQHYRIRDPVMNVAIQIMVVFTDKEYASYIQITALPRITNFDLHTIKRSLVCNINVLPLLTNRMTLHI